MIDQRMLAAQQEALNLEQQTLDVNWGHLEVASRNFLVAVCCMTPTYIMTFLSLSLMMGCLVAVLFFFSNGVRHAMRAR